MDKKGILEALIAHYTGGNKSQFAKILGVKPQTINTWDTRGTFDIELIYSKCEGISGDWLLTGEGEMLKTNGIPRNTPPPATGKSQGKDTKNISDSQENKVQILEDTPSLLAYMKEKDAIHREELKAKDLIIEQKNQELRALDRQVAQLEGELRQYRTAASAPIPLPGTPPVAQ